MPRMQLRPIYDETELTGGEQIAQGVSGAIDELLRRQEEGRRERNEMAMRGARRVPTPRPSIRERFGQLIGRDQQPAARTPPPTGPIQPTFPTPPTFPGRGGAPNVTPSTPPPRRPAAPSISQALDPIVLEGSRGDRYEIDPRREVEAARVARRAQLEDEDVFAQARESRAREQRDAEMQRQVEAAVAAGVPREEAVFRARTGTFGTHPRLARPTGGLSFEQRKEIEDLRQRGRIAVQALIAGRGNSQRQLAAAKAVQESLDRKVAQLQNELSSARRAYDDERVHAILEELNEARSAADDHRAAMGTVPRQRPATDSSRRRPVPRPGGGRTPPRTAKPRTIPPPVNDR